MGWNGMGRTNIGSSACWEGDEARWFCDLEDHAVASTEFFNVTSTRIPRLYRKRMHLPPPGACDSHAA
jgi:hypothetical protein